MKRLWLLRHAKSSWDDPSLPDQLRPLAERGYRATTGLARHLEESELAPALVLCSPARRTTQTWEGISDGLPAETRIEIEDDLYGASAVHLLNRLRRVPAEVDSVMVIGHNPGLEDLADLLVGAGEPDLRQRLAAKFPTGALAGLAVPGHWLELSRGQATLTAYVVPRELD